MNKVRSLKKYFDRSYWNATTITEAVAFLIFVIQLLFIVYINIFCCKSWIDHDASMTYSHTIEMWKQKRLVLPGYAEETFLHLDTACIPAVLFYGLTKDIFLAYGLSNVLFLAIYLFVIFDIAKKLTNVKTYSYIAAILFLIPYRIGMLEYTTMLFYEVSFYSYCIIVPLMGIDLFLYEKDEINNNKAKYYTIFALYFILNAISAFSRGTYLLFVGIAPILVCYIIDIIISDDYKKVLCRDKIILVASSLVSFALGMLYGKIINAAPNNTGYNLVRTHEIVDNFLSLVWAYLSIFLNPYSAPQVISLYGIRNLILFAFAIFTIIIVIFNCKHLFKEEKISKALRYLTLVLIWNACVLGLTQCNTSDAFYPERYLFPGFVPILISVPIMLDYCGKIKKDLLKRTLYLIVSLVILCTLFVCNIGIFEGFKENKADTQGMRDVIQYARDNGIKTIIYLNDDNGSFITRSLAPDLKTVSVDFKEDGTYYLCNREYYKCARDRGYFDDANVLAVPWDMQPENYLNYYLMSSYTPAGDVKAYHLYVAGSNKFDDKVGFPLDDNVLNEWIDFPHSNGYQYAGDIDAYGYLETTGNGDYSLISPKLDAPYCACDITVNYEIGFKTSDEAPANSDGHVIGQITVLDEGLNVVASEDLKDDVASATVRYNDMQKCFVGIKLNNGEKCTIHDIHFTAIN